MRVAPWRIWSKIILKTVAAVEKLADVSSNILEQSKLATRVVQHESTNIKNHLVKNDKLLAAFYGSVKLRLWYARLLFHLPLNFARQYSPMVIFTEGQYDNHS